MLVSRPLVALRTKFSAVCTAAEVLGDLVYISNDISSQDYVVKKADVTNVTKMPAIAVIVFKSSPTECLIQFSGEIKDIYTGLVAGRPYFVGTDGQPSLSPPVPTPGMRAYVQSIGVAVDAEILRLEPMSDMIVRVG